MKVVLDTNVLISGILWEGNESRVLKLCKTNDLKSITSAQIIWELEGVLSRKKFDLSQNEVNLAVALVLSFSKLVRPKTRIDVIGQHPEDNRILECAIEGKADLIITGDAHLLALKEYSGIKIMNARDFLKTIETPGAQPHKKSK